MQSFGCHPWALVQSPRRFDTFWTTFKRLLSLLTSLFCTVLVLWGWYLGLTSTEVWHLSIDCCHLWSLLDIAILHRSCFLSLDRLDRPWQLYLTTVPWCSWSLVLSLVQFLIAKNLANRTLIFRSWFVGQPGLLQSWMVILFQINSCHRTQSFMNRDITHSVIHVIAIEHLLALSPMNDWLALLFSFYLQSPFAYTHVPLIYNIFEEKDHHGQ